jgi:hypothetical protein
MNFQFPNGCRVHACRGIRPTRASQETVFFFLPFLSNDIRCTALSRSLSRRSTFGGWESRQSEGGVACVRISKAGSPETSSRCWMGTSRRRRRNSSTRSSNIRGPRWPSRLKSCGCKLHFDGAILLNYLHPPILFVPFVIRLVHVHHWEAKNEYSRTNEEFADFPIRARALRSSCCRTRMALIGNSG